VIMGDFVNGEMGYEVIIVYWSRIW